MKIPLTPNNDDSIICPECGSDNIEILEDIDITSNTTGQKHHQYKCHNCECEFIPAYEHCIKESMIKQWGKRVHVETGNWSINEGERQYRRHMLKTKPCLIIKKKKK